MRIYISYSSPDVNTVASLAEQLKLFGDVYYWKAAGIPKQVEWEKIYNWIDNSDIFLVLITGNTVVRGVPVIQEVARAKSKNKYILPMVSGNISEEELGFLSGLIYQKVSTTNPIPAITDIIDTVNKHFVLKEKKENIALGITGVGFLVWLLSDKH